MSLASSTSTSAATASHSSTTAEPLIPIIDFAPFLSGDADAKLATAKELFDAAHNVGFMMLKNYDTVCPQSQVEEAFDKVKQFFSLPIEVKDKLAWQTPESNRGYVRQGRERVTQATSADEIAALRAKAPDVKETMEIGKDYDSVWHNMWPEEEMPSFKPFMNGFFETCHNLHVEIMRALALAMGLGENYFDEKIDGKAHNLRLLNYPPVERKLMIQSGGNRAGAHSDYGSVTLLFQDMVGGLEVQDKAGQFVPARPVAQTVVVNVGDLLQRWSNDVLKSTIHRVVLPTGDEGAETTPQRNSIAFFSNPNLKQMIECLPGTGEPKYAPVECERYLVRRLMAAIAPTSTSVDEAHYLPNVQSNNNSLYYVKSTTASISGATAGVLGLTNLNGFAFYLLTSILIGLVFVGTKGGRGYFPGNVATGVVLGGLLENAFPFVLFWTLFYALVHIYD